MCNVFAKCGVTCTTKVLSVEWKLQPSVCIVLKIGVGIYFQSILWYTTGFIHIVFIDKDNINRVIFIFVEHCVAMFQKIMGAARSLDSTFQTFFVNSLVRLPRSVTQIGRQTKRSTLIRRGRGDSKITRFSSRIYFINIAFLILSLSWITFVQCFCAKFLRDFCRSRGEEIAFYMHLLALWEQFFRPENHL